MEIHELVIEMKLLERRLSLYEEKYGILSEDFHSALQEGKFDQYDAFVLTGNLPVSKKIGLKASKKVTLFNGPIECRILHYKIYKGSRKNKTVE